MSALGLEHKALGIWTKIVPSGNTGEGKTTEVWVGVGGTEEMVLINGSQVAALHTFNSSCSF